MALRRFSVFSRDWIGCRRFPLYQPGTKVNFSNKSQSAFKVLPAVGNSTEGAAVQGLSVPTHSMAVLFSDPIGVWIVF